MNLPASIQNLIDEFSKLPGVGPKTAARLVFYLLTKPKTEIEVLGRSVLDLSANLTYCNICFNISESDLCLICTHHERNHNVIMVVEEPLDVIAIERSSGFKGVYHVLGGVISPINGVGPEELRISQLLERIKQGQAEEIVLATNPNLEGEATATYIREKVRELKMPVVVTRIARGLPNGGDLEYADEVTLKRSLEGRREY